VIGGRGVEKGKEKNIWLDGSVEWRKVEKI